MNDTQVIGFKANQALIELIDQHARRTDRSRSGMLRTMVNDWIMDKAASKLVDAPVPYCTEQERA